MVPKQTFIDQIKKQRTKEIKKGLHLHTNPPLYCVYNVCKKIADYPQSYSLSTSYFVIDEIIALKKEKELCLKINFEDIELFESEGYEILTRYYYDEFVTCFFTKKETKEFIKNNKNKYTNLKIYVEYIHKNNQQFNQLLGI